MNFKALILFAAATLSLIAVARGHGSTEDLQTFLARTSANDCYNKFAEYTRSLIDDSQNKSINCEEISDQEKSGAYETASEQRDELARAAKTTCSALEKCYQKDTSTEAMQCLEKEGEEARIKMSNIASDAAQNLSDLEDTIRAAENRKHKCTNEVKAELDSNMSQAGVELTNCMRIDNYKWITVKGIEVEVEEPSTEQTN